MPDDADELRRLGRSLGLRADPVERARPTQWRQHAREVRRLHEKLFYRPLLDAVARLASGRGAAHAGGGALAARGARATPTRRARCATSRR